MAACDSHSGATPAIAQGPLHADEAVVLVGYVGTILLIVTGPSHCWKPPLWRAKHPPCLLDKTVYAPVLGVVYLALVDLCRSGKESLITLRAIREVLKDKLPIVVLIESFALLSISLDASGLLKACASSMVLRSRGSGVRLLLYMYALCSVLSYFTTNDVVVISMTPIIIHICLFAGIKDAVPLLITQFIAAHTACMATFMGSPTNIILGDAVQLTFVGYWALMAIPTVVSILATLLMVMLVFVFVPFGVPVEQQIPEGVSSQMEEKVEDGVESPRPASVLEPRSTSYTRAGGPEELTIVVPAAMQSPAIRRIKVLIFVMVLALLCVSDYIHAPLWVVALCSASVMLAMDVAMVAKERASVPTFLGQVNGRMPWSIGPFVICMFLMVRVLTGTGFTGRFSRWMVAAGGTRPLTQALAFGYISAVLVNFLNDLPSTVFWADMLPLLCSAYHDDEQHHYHQPPQKAFRGVIMALLVGVNLGCYLTIIGALAGLMWRNIIRTQPGVEALRVPTAMDLSYYGVVVLVPVMFVTCVSVALVHGLW